MSIDDFTQIVTKRDLYEFRIAIEESFRKMLEDSKEKQKFYSPRQFSEITNIPYSTVVQHCNSGLLKARQDRPGSSWQIDSCELHRYKEEATKNIY